MKRTVSLALAVLVLASAFVFFPRPAEAGPVDKCYDNYDNCWDRAMNANVSTLKRTLMFTMCDLAFGYCLFKAQLV